MELLWPIAYFGIAIMAHALLARFDCRGNRVFQFLLTGSLAGVVLIAHVISAEWSSAQSAAVLAIYAFACELYLFLFTLVGTSISVQLLVELKKRRLTGEQLLEINNPRRMVETRLARLIATGYLQENDCQYRLSATGKRLVWLYSLLQRCFFPGPQTDSDPDNQLTVMEN
jgi:hypothetical protein